MGTINLLENEQFSNTFEKKQWTISVSKIISQQTSSKGKLQASYKDNILTELIIFAQI